MDLMAAATTSGCSQPASSEKNSSMYWTKTHDILYCREVLVSKLFETKKSSVERGKVWDDIADNLNSIEEPSFDVDKRSVRDRLNNLVKKYKKKMKKEENSSGISPEKTELDSLL